MADGADVCDGDLARLARDGDPVAFRLLVERHQPMARARAWGLCANPVRVPADCDVIAFGIYLAGPGRVEMRNPELIRHT